MTKRRGKKFEKEEREGTDRNEGKEKMEGKTK